MTIKLLQLNILKGLFIDRVIDFVKKENFDIINFQEVFGGKMSYQNIDCFQILKNSLKNYKATLSVAFNLVNDKQSYCGNAIFVRNDFRILKEETVWIKFDKNKELTFEESQQFEELPRACLAQFVEIAGKKIWILNTHSPWSPIAVDTEMKIAFSHKIFNFLKSINEPFVFTGDFNANPQTKTVSMFNSVARNLVVENKITNTLNPKVHRAKEVFPKGVVVDFIFIDKSLRVKKFRLIDEIDLSDHFGLLVEFEI